MMGGFDKPQRRELASGNQAVHLDLFSGIGGFAYAIDNVWSGVEHVFVEYDDFCQQVLKKHWPEATVYADIRQITTNPLDKRLEGQLGEEAPGQRGQRSGVGTRQKPFILTGGFPCQPFSAAGQRRGTDDDRYLWPEMFRVIRLTKPEWVIAENVRGLVTWNEGMVLETVCADLESQGYEVQPFIIPAVALNAPHRRDRIWFVARNTKHDGFNGAKDSQSSRTGNDHHSQGAQQVRQPQGANPLWFDTESWEQNWLEVAARVCGVDDGLPRRVDRLKSLGNAIVPQVAEQLIRGIDLVKQDLEANTDADKIRKGAI